MVARSPSRLAHLFGALAFGLALIALVASLAGLGATPAAAQGYGWFGNLFGGGQPQQRPQQPNYPGYGGQGGDGGGEVYVPRHRVRRHPPTQAQAPRRAPRDDTAEKPPPPKKNASEFVYVFGDSFGQFLANGLDEALADRQDVSVVHKARGPTGLVNKDYFDWPKAIDAELDPKDKASKDKIDVAVMMIGSNDRQPITEDGKTYDVGSDDWKAIYRKRVMAIDDAFRKKGIPLIWVGVPITKSTDFADTMAVINDITRDAAEKTGATYVDTWGAFSDDNGDFAAYGPDVNGQVLRLRSADGILFTHAGARKLAHFVEAHVRRDLDGKAPPPVLPTAGTPEAQAALGKLPNGEGQGHAKAPSPAPKPEAGPITNLNQVPSAGNGELASPTKYRGDAASALMTGDTGPIPAGRADDPHWAAAPKP